MQKLGNVRRLLFPMQRVIRGVCNLCGCDGHWACIDDATEESCAWADAEQTLCTSCVANGRPPLGVPSDIRGWGEAIKMALEFFGQEAELGPFVQRTAESQELLWPEFCDWVDILHRAENLGLLPEGVSI